MAGFIERCSCCDKDRSEGAYFHIDAQYQPERILLICDDCFEATIERNPAGPNSWWFEKVQREPMKLKDIAKQLHDYMQFRAKREGMEYGLKPSFFHNALIAGTKGFFGVQVDDNGLIEDTQQPAMFAEWKRTA
jgi:hypothetical protein